MHEQPYEVNSMLSEPMFAEHDPVNAIGSGSFGFPFILFSSKNDWISSSITAVSVEKMWKWRNREIFLHKN